MKYSKNFILKDGRECLVRSAREEDAEGVLNNFILTHGQSDFLTSYPDEIMLTIEKERKYLKTKEESEREVELIAVVRGKVAGTAGVDSIGGYYKLRHRGSFGISVDRDFWGLGIGRALTECCIECARKMGYVQLELEVVASNRAALSLYESVGFTVYGRNPKGFNSRVSGYQENLLMRLEL